MLIKTGTRHITYVNDTLDERIDLYIARDDTTTFVEMAFYVDGQGQWCHDGKTRFHKSPSPHAARAAMVAYGRDLQAKGFACA
jgi:hypothetical protein